MFPVSWGMGKMTRGEFITRLEELNPDVDYKKVLKFFERQTSKRPETNKEVLRNSWVFDVCFHVYHGAGTTKETKIKSKIIRNYVTTQHYKDNYKLFQGRDWLSLKAIQDYKKEVEERQDKRRAKIFVESFAVKQHVKNCNALLISPLGKHLTERLNLMGGFFHAKGNGPSYLRELKKKHKTHKGKLPIELEDYGRPGAWTKEDDQEYPWELVVVKKKPKLKNVLTGEVKDIPK